MRLLIGVSGSPGVVSLGLDLTTSCQGELARQTASLVLVIVYQVLQLTQIYISQVNQNSPLIIPIMIYRFGYPQTRLVLLRIHWFVFLKQKRRLQNKGF